MNANQLVETKANTIVINSHTIMSHVWNELIVHVTSGYKLAQPVFCNTLGCMNAIESEEFGSVAYRSETVFMRNCILIVIVQSNE